MTYLGGAPSQMARLIRGHDTPKMEPRLKLVEETR